MKPREKNYDLLRVLAAVAVVFIHVNQHYCGVGRGKGLFIVTNEYVLDTFTRFCVPCFLMISGAFILHNKRNRDFKYFYKKSFYKIGIPFIMVSVCLFCFDVLWCLTTGQNLRHILGTYVYMRYYNLWFMVVLLEIYLLVPLLHRLRESVSEKALLILTLALFVFSTVIQFTSEARGSYNLDCSMPYLSWFLLGSLIYENLRGRLKAYPFAIAAAGLYVLWVVLRYMRVLDIFGSISVYFNPLCVLSATAVFIFFSNIQIDFSMGKLPEKTYYIYLVHAAVYRSIIFLLGKNYIINELVTVWTAAIGTFAIAALIATAWMKIRALISQKTTWKEKFISE